MLQWKSAEPGILGTWAALICRPRKPYKLGLHNSYDLGVGILWFSKLLGCLLPFPVCCLPRLQPFPAAKPLDTHQGEHRFSWPDSLPDNQTGDQLGKKTHFKIFLGPISIELIPNNLHETFWFNKSAFDDRKYSWRKLQSSFHTDNILRQVGPNVALERAILSYSRLRNCQWLLSVPMSVYRWASLIFPTYMSGLWASTRQGATLS